MGFGFCSAVNAEILSDGNKSDRVLHANAPRRQNHNLIRRHRQGPNRNGSSKIYRCGRCVEANNQNDNLIAPDEFRGAQHRIYHLLIYVQHFLRLAIQSIENMIDFVLVFGRMLSYLRTLATRITAHVFDKNANYDWLKRFDLSGWRKWRFAVSLWSMTKSTNMQCSSLLISGVKRALADAS